MTHNTPLKVAVLDLNNNVPNQSIGYLRKMIAHLDGLYDGQRVDFEVFDVRFKTELPSADNFDIFVSSGGPGSPFDGEGKEWEEKYFKLLDKLWNHNHKMDVSKKHVFFICHSFQMMCRFFELGQITKRHSTSFGITPVHMTPEGREERVFDGLPDPFWGADFRDFQLIEPDHKRIEELGAKILCREKIRPHVPYERAVMGIRISNEMIGTQFHPEADAQGMKLHFLNPEKKAIVIEHHGEEKYVEMLERLDKPHKIALTQKTVIPTFFRDAICNLREIRENQAVLATF